MTVGNWLRSFRSEAPAGASLSVLQQPALQLGQRVSDE